MLKNTEVNIGTFMEILVSQHSWLDKREDHWIRLEYQFSAYRDFLTEVFWTGSRIVKTETRFSKYEDGMGNPEISLQYVYDIQFIDEEEQQ